MSSCLHFSHFSLSFWHFIEILRPFIYFELPGRIMPDLLHWNSQILFFPRDFIWPFMFVEIYDILMLGSDAQHFALHQTNGAKRPTAISDPPIRTFDLLLAWLCSGYSELTSWKSWTWCLWRLFQELSLSLFLLILSFNIYYDDQRSTRKLVLPTNSLQNFIFIERQISWQWSLQFLSFLAWLFSRWPETVFANSMAKSRWWHGARHNVREVLKFWDQFLSQQYWSLLWFHWNQLHLE